MNNETRNDLAEIWKYIESIKNSISKIEKYVMDDYYNEIVIDFYAKEEK